jgi:hypothetical protein
MTRASKPALRVLLLELLSPNKLDTKREHTICDVGNPDDGLGQIQQCGEARSVIGIPTLSSC